MGCERCDGEGGECCGRSCEVYVSRSYHGGYDVGMSGVGAVLAGLPEAWARKAEVLLSACRTAEAQSVELQRIRRSLEKVPATVFERLRIYRSVGY